MYDVNTLFEDTIARLKSGELDGKKLSSMRSGFRRNRQVEKSMIVASAYEKYKDMLLDEE